MKLKYYLRGLAVGIILTTVILAIANGDNRPMTDAEVRKRALELGMIESDSVKLTDVAVSDGDTEEDESSEPNQSSTAVEETGETEEATETSAEVSTETSAEVSTEASAEEPTETSAEASTDASTEASTEEDLQSIVFTIKSGDSSYTVSKALAAAGLVEDAVEFDNYLCDNGYSRTIRTGTYELSVGMSYEEIAKIIAR